MAQKTFDGQTATFLSKLITAFPSDLTGEEMQKCIDNPIGLQNAIRAQISRTTASNSNPSHRELSSGELRVKFSSVIRENFTDAELEKMSLSYATSLHEFIVDFRNGTHAFLLPKKEDLAGRNMNPGDY